MIDFAKRRTIAAAIGCAFAAALAGCGQDEAPAETSAKPLTPIGLVQLVEHEALDAAARGIVDALAERGFKEGVNISIDRQNAQADQSNLHNIASRFVSQKDALIFAIATPAAQTVARATKEIPIVATAITDFESAKLVQSVEKPGTNVTGVSDIGPIADQLKLLLRFTKGDKTIGTIYSSSEANSAYQVDLLKKAANELGVTVLEATVSNVNDIQQAVASLKGKVSGLYIPTDNVLASAVPALVKVTEPAGIPTVAGEGGPVRAGCLATISVDYYELGRMTGFMGADILEGKKKPAEMPVETQQNAKVVINMKAAKALGVTVPEDLKKGAELIE